MIKIAEKFTELKRYIPLKLLDRYLSAEIIKPFIYGLLGFIIILLGNTLYIYADLIIKNHVPFLDVLFLLLYNIPASLVVAFPVALMFGILITLGRMSRDSEIIAMKASGISLWRITAPLFAVAIGVSILNFYFNEIVVPWANNQSQHLVQEIILKRPMPAIQENVFFSTNDDRYFYIKRVDRHANKLFDIMIFEYNGTRIPKVITAQEASFTGSKWLLNSGIYHQYGDDGFLKEETTFSDMEIKFDRDVVKFFEAPKSPQEMSTKELKQQIKLFDRSNADTKGLKVDYYLKYSIPMACFFAALIAIPFGLMFSKGGAYLGVGISIVLVFIYYVVMSFSRSFGVNGAIDPFLAAWSQNIIFAVVGLIFLFRLR
jgi:LPS export ABC transporter permease LptG